MFQLDKSVHLRSALESKDSQIKQMERVAYFNWYAEGSERLQDSKIASMKDLLQKTNGKLKTREVPKTKDNRTDVSTTAPLYSQVKRSRGVPLVFYSQPPNSLSELPSYSEETVK